MTFIFVATALADLLRGSADQSIGAASMALPRTIELAGTHTTL